MARCSSAIAWDKDLKKSPPHCIGEKAEARARSKQGAASLAPLRVVVAYSRHRRVEWSDLGLNFTLSKCAKHRIRWTACQASMRKSPESRALVSVVVKGTEFVPGACLSHASSLSATVHCCAAGGCCGSSAKSKARQKWHPARAACPATQVAADHRFEVVRVIELLLNGKIACQLFQRGSRVAQSVIRFTPDVLCAVGVGATEAQRTSLSVLCAGVLTARV